MRKSRNIGQKGHGSFRRKRRSIVAVKRIGFVQFEDWGEAAWTARDLR